MRDVKSLALFLEALDWHMTVSDHRVVRVNLLPPWTNVDIVADGHRRAASPAPFGDAWQFLPECNRGGENN